MSDCEISQEALTRARYALTEIDHPSPFQRDAGLPVVLDELREWLEDDRQWLSAYNRQWVSLLDDILVTREDAGKNLEAFLNDLGLPWQEFELCRAALKNQRRDAAADPAIRRRLERASAAVADRLTDPLILGATWDDLMATKTYATALAEAQRLALFVGRQGLDVKTLVRELRSILEDETAAIDYARGESFDKTKINQRAGLSPGERASLARSQLFEPPRRADAVIWLKYALAPFAPDMLEVGETVTLYKASWLRSKLCSGSEDELPPELQGDEEDLHVKVLAGASPSAESEESNEKDEAIPHVLVRVALGEKPTAEALGLARETAELVISLATLHGADPSIWVLTESYVSYYDGQESGAAFHREPVREPTLDQSRAMRADPLPEVVNEWAGDLAPHLPLERPDLRRAAKLALWLRKSREVWEPGQIVLCDRVFEQVAGWAGVVDRGRFIRQHLRLSWALQRIRQEISSCWSAVYAARIGFDSSLSKEGWEEIKADETIGYEPVNGGGYTINLRGVLLRLDFLLDHISANTPLYERLHVLRTRTQDGKATAKWVNELLTDFDALEHRTRRARNALVHGGPVGDDMARSVLTFVEWLSSEALYTAIKGFLSDKDLIDQFLDRREAYERSFSRLQQNESPAEALFWES